VDERRAQLLELGMALFGSRSYEEVSIDDIARSADISKGLLYHYFGSKRGFYVATVRAAADELLARTAPDPSQPPPVRVRAGLLAYLAFVEEKATAYAALMRSGLGTDPELAEIVEDTRTAIVERVLEGLSLARPRPLFRLSARAWVGAVEASSLDWLDRRDVSREDWVRMLLALLAASLSTAATLDPDAEVDLSGLGR
jgi:AcrR family transcriptional regulator